MSKPNTTENFWSKVRKTLQCWEWTASLDSRGYGHLRWHGTLVLAHRKSYEISISAIPDEMHVLHRCDNRRCVRPDHLFLGTHDDNMKDMAKKKRHKHGNDGLGGAAILSREKITAILYLLAMGHKHRELGAYFGVDKNTIGRIARGQAYMRV